MTERTDRIVAGILTPLLWAILAVVVVGTLGGCNLFDSHAKQMDLLRGMAADVAGRLEDGSVGQIAASGQALNPGIKVEAAITYSAVARYDGLAGQFQISSAGKMGSRQLPDEILRIINDSSLSDEARTAIIRDLILAATSQPASP